jgi:hypothetical protein
VAFSLTKALVRRAALDDLEIALTVVTWTLRLLRVSARGSGEYQFVGELLALLEDARRQIRRL